MHDRNKAGPIELVLVRFYTIVPTKMNTIRKLKVGNHSLVWDKTLVPMTDSTDSYNKGLFSALREQLQHDGFLFIRNIIPYEDIYSARLTILSHLQSKGVIKEGTTLLQGIMSEKQMKMPGWTIDATTGGIVDKREADSEISEWKRIGTSTAVTNIYNGSALKKFYQNIFQEDSDSTIHAFPECTWIRAKGAGELTNEHADYYYFRSKTDMFSSTWNPEKQNTKENTAEVRIRYIGFI